MSLTSSERMCGSWVSCACSFLHGVFTLFDVPYKVAQELCAANAGVKDITPKHLRKMLRKLELSTEEVRNV